MKILVVDDSAVMRSALRNILHGAGHVVEVACNGAEALEKLETFPADVMTLDVEMPVMNGLECLRRIMATAPRPVVMVSTLTAEDAETGLTALHLGAVDVMAKPRRDAGGIRGASQAIVRKVEAAAKARVVRNTASLAAPHAPELGGPPALVVVGASTGGPPVVHDLLTSLPADFPAPILVALHMPPGFTTRFVERMAEKSRGLKIVEVTSSQPIEAGTAYLAPGGRDLIVAGRLDALVADPVEMDEASIWHPSVGRLVASAMGLLPPERIVGVMLTGMGDDGAREMAALRERGGATVAESEDSAIIYGMPGALVDRGGATVVLHRDQIGAQLSAWARRLQAS